MMGPDQEFTSVPYVWDETQKRFVKYEGDPNLIGECLCETCEDEPPFIATVPATQAAELNPFNSFIISKPAGCIVTVETSVGTVIVGKDQATFASDPFSCEVTMNSISIAPADGCDVECNLEDVTITVQKI